ncbi:lipoprotein-releasing ABC transporter ATP-binding protein LolD [Pseudidiomarina taiwanensis]|uniref:Lipoprotein-releasing system ATP-binding protein LolD n=1 Tax=Pseudidiomarina taiwanensis TaxID=337250 RepID=A0A432ZMM8_9GAMM|nr:lipoprotein-releasing ABC transporter ATP-binding protein LolD [Pseudidiomarina taiwanensis]RUO79143.1 lipoprotein-releasing system ATP-binding protein LolD [Pseudidiomarina taiwanensis]
MNKVAEQNPAEVILECRQLGRHYDDGTQQLVVLSEIDFCLHKGELVAILGSSGSGKSTLLHCLGGLDHPNNGEVLFNGQNIQAWNANQLADWRNQELGFIYQFHHLLPEFNALENVMLPQLIGGVSHSLAEQKAQQLLARVGMQARQHHRPSELSGGERQRVAIARALANDPAVVLADEPTGNLDDKNAEQVFELLLELNTELATAFVVVTHDYSLAQRCQRRYQLQHGRLVTDAK